MTFSHALITKWNKTKVAKRQVCLFDCIVVAKITDISKTGKLEGLMDTVAHLIFKGWKSPVWQEDKLEAFNSRIYVCSFTFLVGFALPLNSLIFEVLKRIWMWPYMLPIIAGEFWMQCSSLIMSPVSSGCKQAILHLLIENDGPLYFTLHSLRE